MKNLLFLTSQNIKEKPIFKSKILNNDFLKTKKNDFVKRKNKTPLYSKMKTKSYDIINNKKMSKRSPS